MLHRYFSTLIIFCCLPFMLLAQLSRTPVTDETTVKEQLFSLDTNDINYYFRTNLPGDNFLVIEFTKFSSWQSKDMLQQICNTAAQTVLQVQDSFKYPSASKKLDIHMPVKNAPLTVRLFEHHEDGDLVVIKNGSQAPLKLGMDTIRILKTFEDANSKTLSRMQFTFILKDVDKMQTLAANEMLISDIQKTFDDLVAKKRKQWPKQDKWYHNLEAVYDAQSTTDEDKLQVEKEPGFLKRFNVESSIGASLFQNSLVPYFDYGFYYKWPSRTERGQYGYVAYTISTLALFSPSASGGMNTYGLLFNNIEKGVLYNRKNTRIPVYETAIGFGYKGINSTDPPDLHVDMYRLYFKYSLSRAITFTSDFYFVSKAFDNNKDSDFSIFTGITVAYKFLNF